MPLPDIFFTLVATGLLIIYWKRIKEALENISNHFGDPPAPMAPLPSSDSHLLFQRSRKKPSVL